MSTELRRQVQSLQQRQALGATVPLSKGRPSLFLTTSEAAGVDVSTVFEAAVKGLNTLQQYDSRFEVFHTNLLHPSSIELQRDLKTAEVISIYGRIDDFK